MSKRVRIEPIAQESHIETNGNLLSVLIQENLNILKECGGRGMCATCHVYIQAGMNSLSPIAKREQRTLAIITTYRPNSRLACQAQVMTEGVIIELPVGMYIQSIQDLKALIGRRCEKQMLHPVTGQTLVEVGQLITRSMVRQLETTDFQIGDQIARGKNV
jgi:ferredoxin